MSVTSVMNFLHGVQLVWIAMANMMDEWLMYVLPIFSSATSNIDYNECMIVSKMSVLGEKLYQQAVLVLLFISFVLDRSTITGNSMLHSCLLNNNCVSYQQSFQSKRIICFLCKLV